MNLDALGKVDVILVTQGHGDHTGDVKVGAERTGATVLGPAGLIATMVDLGWVSPDKAVRFGKGGHVNPMGPQITITQVRAEQLHHHLRERFQALYATKQMLKPKYAIPFHYGTFPVLKGTPQEYQQHLGQTTTQVFPVNPGDKLTF
jgi:L-ascorbate metabolism protein UlaG (beta-lactamase superfamily)